jgi:hypothetical protein
MVSLLINDTKGGSFMNLKTVFIMSIVSACLFFVGVVSFAEKTTKTYYNNKVPYSSLFQNFNTNQLKIQVQTKNGKVQAEIPVVNDAEKDVTQKKGN